MIGDPRAVWMLYDLLSRECPRCGGRVHPLVDLDGDDHFVLVETPLVTEMSGSFIDSYTVTVTCSKYVGVRRCTEFEWPRAHDLGDDNGGEGACTYGR